jgi:hypothetical protein
MQRRIHIYHWLATFTIVAIVMWPVPTGRPLFDETALQVLGAALIFTDSARRIADNNSRSRRLIFLSVTVFVAATIAVAASRGGQGPFVPGDEAATRLLNEVAAGMTGFVRVGMQGVAVAAFVMRVAVSLFDALAAGGLAVRGRRRRDRRQVILQAGTKRRLETLLDANHAYLAHRLNLRAVAMRRQSMVMLTLIVVLILMGVVTIFATIDVLTGSASVPVTRLAQTQSVLVSAREDFNSLTQMRDGTVAEIANNRRAAWSLVDPEASDIAISTRMPDKQAVAIGAADTEVNALLDIYRGREDSLNQHLVSLNGYIDGARAVYTALGTSIAQSWQKDLTLVGAEAERDGWLKSSVTRLGVLLIIVFLVQILLSVFRYCTRIAAFYHSRADAMVLIGRSPGDLHQTSRVLNPEKIGFGGHPESPWSAVAKVLWALRGTKAPNERKKTREAVTPAEPQAPPDLPPER